MHIRMVAKTKRSFAPKGGKQFTQKGKGNFEALVCVYQPISLFSQLQVLFCPDSLGTKPGGRPGSRPSGKKHFQPHTDKKKRPWKDGDGGKKQNKFSISKASKGSQKRKLPPLKTTKEGEEGEKTSESFALFLFPFHVKPFDKVTCVSLLNSKLTVNRTSEISAR